MIAGLAGTFDVVPLTATPSYDALGQIALDGFAQVFVLGLEVAAPALIALVVVDAALGAGRARGAAAEHVLGRPAGEDPGRVRGRRCRRCRSSPTTSAPSSRARCDRRSSRSAGRAVAASDKTEKATPKRRQDARKKGQIARSTEVNTAVVLLATVGALAVFGPRMLTNLEDDRPRRARDRRRPGQRRARLGPGGAARRTSSRWPARSPRSRSSRWAPGCSRASLQVRPQLTPARDQAVVQEAQPAHGHEARVRARTRSSSARKAIAKTVVVGVGHVLRRLAASCRASARSSASRPTALPGVHGRHGDAHRDARGARAARDRGGRPRLAALPAREVAADDASRRSSRRPARATSRPRSRADPPPAARVARAAA